MSERESLCVCVFACVQEREWDREREGEFVCVHVGVCRRERV